MIHLLAAGVAMCLQAHLPAGDCKADGEIDADRFIEEVLTASGSPGGVWLADGRSSPEAVQAAAQGVCNNLMGTALKAVPVYRFTDRSDQTQLGTYFACVREPTS